jgi:diguanylate cyclase (GGDEF)-like protein/PAS domain S-box-containing protein
MDSNKVIVQTNQAAETLLGIEEIGLIGKRNTELKLCHLGTQDPLLPEQLDTQLETLHGDASYEHPKRGKRVIHYNCAPIQAQGATQGFVLTIQDVTDNHYALSAANHQAQHDALTGLPNRLLLDDRLAQLSALAHRSGTQVAIIFLDLDGFKPVNDTYGHAVGDVILIHVAQQLTSLLRESDTVARLGGDEFVMLLGYLESPQEIEALAKRILEHINQPIHLESVSDAIHIGASLGIAIYPQDGIEAAALLRQADIAMYRAKENGRNRWCYAQKK